MYSFNYHIIISLNIQIMASNLYNKIMIEKPTKLAFQNVSGLCAAIRQLSFQTYRFHDSLISIVDSACGNLSEKGILQQRTLQYISSSPIDWTNQMDELYNLLGPKSYLMGKIKDFANNQMSINIGYLAKCIIQQFPKVGVYQSRLIRGLRRQITNNFTIRLWQWFWICFIRSFMEINIEQNRNFIDEFTQDEFFYNLSRNIYLGFFLKSLITLNKQLKGRLINLIHIYLIQQFFYKLRKRQIIKSDQDINYKVKSHYFYLLYILILTNDQIPQEVIKIYYQYLEKIAINYSSNTILNINYNIRNMIRVWITLTTRTVTIENILIDKLKFANQKQGWFRLARCPIEKFEASLTKLNINLKEEGRSITTETAIVKLLDKFSEWQPSYTILTTIQQLLVLENKLNSNQHRQYNEQQGSIIVRAIERTLTNLIQKGNNKDIIIQIHERLNKKIQKLYHRGVLLNYDENYVNKINNNKYFSRLEDRRKLLNNNNRIINVWQYPLQQNEFKLLYNLSYWIANKIDIIIPGKKQNHPRINIRILANPFIFFAIIFMIAMIIRSQ